MDYGKLYIRHYSMFSFISNIEYTIIPSFTFNWFYYKLDLNLEDDKLDRQLTDSLLYSSYIKEERIKNCQGIGERN